VICVNFTGVLAVIPHDRWQASHRRFGRLLAVCWLMRYRPKGDCWLEPTKALWFPEIFSKNIKNFNMLFSAGGMAFRSA